MSAPYRQGRIEVAAILQLFIEREVLSGLGLDPKTFWADLEKFLADLAPRNRALLARRDALQEQIDDWHRDRRGQDFDAAAYLAFLTAIGYLAPPAAEFKVGTAKVDPEISTQAGPQLVVPITNARYALNAANARWGSLYDALYGTDALASPIPAPKPTIPRVAEKSSNGAARFWTGSLRWRAPRIRMSGNILSKAAPCAPDLVAARPAPLPIRRVSPDMSALPRPQKSCCLFIMACMSKSMSTVRTRLAEPMARASATSCWSRR